MCDFSLIIIFLKRFVNKKSSWNINSSIVEGCANTNVFYLIELSKHTIKIYGFCIRQNNVPKKRDDRLCTL